MDSALQCLVLVARQHGVELSVERLKREHAITEAEVSENALLAIARQAGLQARQMRADWAALQGAQAAFPMVARLNNGFSVVLTGLRQSEGADESIQLLDPLAAEVELLSVPRQKFEAAWTGGVCLFSRASEAGATSASGANSFGWPWFWQEVLAQKRVFGHVILVALILHLLAFAPALFSQIVFDKVLVYRAEDTLHVLFGGILLALIFGGVLGLVRSLLLLKATSKIDIRVAAFSYKRLLSLPLALFQHAPAGMLVKHMQQATQIREFFTGSLLLTLIEMLSLVVVLPVLAFFSWQLTLVVIVFSALIAANSLLGIYGNKINLEKLYLAEGDRQATLFETINGMETVKSMALEPLQMRRWLDISSATVHMQYAVGRLSTVSSEVSGFLMKAMGVVLTWMGAMLVLNNQITIGATVAFSMLAMRVTGPLVQFVQLVSKYQQAGISIRMLAGLMNQPPERERQGGITPDVRGAIDFDRVGFRYQAQGQPVLDQVQLHFQAGQTIGVVGRSGSGKSTLAKLLLGLVQPTSGVVRIDGRDVREFDLTHLRTQIGMVSQRNFLFKGTVRENIAKARPGASLDDVVEAARLARADSFIEQLPQGYDTPLEEDASNLSGGQKQRLALARALTMKPRILVLDEATSALDPESEALIREAMPAIARGRTVINISHRLDSLVGMDVIVVIDAGRVVDAAPHAVLLQRCALYRQLWIIQHPMPVGAQQAVQPSAQAGTGRAA
jgi:ATP-binding cassette, subfamily B, bacterial HlyB/CyaB